MIKKLLISFVFVLFLWMAGFGIYALASLSLKTESNAQTDAVVVLTGGDKRIETGLELFASGAAPYLFISGVHPDVTDAEIRAMWTGSKPLPDCCIELGRKAQSTIQNAQETKQWMDSMHFKSIRLVTANYHMYRAWLELGHAMPNVQIIPESVVQPNLDKFRFWTLMFKEYNKALFRKIYLMTGAA